MILPPSLAPKVRALVATVAGVQHLDEAIDRHTMEKDVQYKRTTEVPGTLPNRGLGDHWLLLPRLPLKNVLCTPPLSNMPMTKCGVSKVGERKAFLRRYGGAAVCVPCEVIVVAEVQYVQYVVVGEL